MAVTYDPRQPDIPGIVGTAYRAATEDPGFKKTFPEKPLVAYRKQKTIGDNVNDSCGYTRRPLKPTP